MLGSDAWTSRGGLGDEAPVSSLANTIDATRYIRYIPSLMGTDMRLVFLVMLSLAVTSCATVKGDPEIALAEVGDDEVAWVCPMHADVTSDKAGNCVRCGMALVLGKPFDMRDYRLQVETLPALPRAGEKLTLQFKVLDPASDEPVTDFELVHEMPYHLFVVSQDMEFFQHIHPAEREGGVWVIDIVLPKPGNYFLVSDFAPKGSSSQMVAHPLITAGAGEDLLAGTARLIPDDSVRLPLMT